jgi:hypothetical protein
MRITFSVRCTFPTIMQHSEEFWRIDISFPYTIYDIMPPFACDTSSSACQLTTWRQHTVKSEMPIQLGGSGPRHAARSIMVVRSAIVAERGRHVYSALIRNPDHVAGTMK